MSTLLIRPQTTPLNGTISVPSDKSISHRAVMLAALAEGTSQVRNWLPAGDTIATLEAMRAMGVPIDVTEVTPQSWDLRVEGRGLHGLQPPAGPLDCRNAGTCMRLLAGIMAGQSFPSVLDGSGQLRKRPMRRITDPLQQMGAKIESVNGRAPLTITPSQLHGVAYRMNVASAQVKSALLLGGLYAAGETRVYQPGPARDHTERMLAAMGVPVVTEGDWVILRGGALWAQDLTVPGDISSAAFPLVAAAIVPHSQITVTNIGYNDTRTGILDMLQAMGATFTIANERVTGGETAVDLTFTFSELHSTEVGGTTVVRGIDEFPIWAVAATQAAGDSTARDAAELRVKEVDRISVLAGELQKLGVNLTEHPDGFTVHGPLRLQGAEVDSHDDHRLGMCLAVAGLVATGETIVHNAHCVADSFPGFVETMQALGANMEWVA
ncbi:MAG: 3-phosphoshikimate 1-carboxyvinyltransferase [Ardenticatenaceae bacterium]|nr:3-phosphoshikimate 1-carboxyvinyltransferase [Ardenticatenaceae bacterium]MCB8946234.1 3-phosphoshikimate 1-carboxyvinyltransferase [Ardenticatenaceae bacterium]